MIVNLAPLVDYGFQIVTLLVTGVVIPVLAAKAFQLMHVNGQSVIAQRVIVAAENGAQMALSKANDTVDASAHVEVKDALVAHAADYVVAAVPGYLKKLGIDPTTDPGRTRLEDLVTAKLTLAAPSLMAPSLAIHTAGVGTIVAPPAPPETPT